jgi:ribose transport system permease protein
LVMMGYQIMVPFLVLGAAALMGSAFVHALFAKARSLDVNAA